VNTLRCFPSAQRHHLLVYASAFCLQSEHCSDGLLCLPVFMFFSSANARSFWGVTAGELCSDGLPCLPVFMFFLRECAVFLGSYSWRTLQRWTAVPACFYGYFFRESAVILGCYSWRTLQRWTAVPACFYVFLREYTFLLGCYSW